MHTDRKTKLNLTPGGVPPVVHVSQYDTAEKISFELWEGTKKFQKPSGALAKIEMTKPDRKGIRKDCIYAEDGTIEINLETQMTCVSGSARSKIVIYDATGQIGTAAFILSVDPAGLADDAVVSESDLQDLREIYEQAITVGEKAKEAANAAEDARSSASAADGSAKAAGKSETAAAESKKNAAESSLAAEKSKDDAAGSAQTAKEKTEAAERYARQAGKSAEDASDSKVAAGQYRDAAEAAAQAAAGYAGEAEYRIGINPATGHPTLYHYTKEES